MTQHTQLIKDPESGHDVLDQDDGLNGGADGGSSWWIYALIGVLVIGGIIALIVCLAGKKKYKHEDFGVPTKGELKDEETQKFVKKFYDLSSSNLTALSAFQVSSVTKPDITAADATKLLDAFEKARLDELTLVKDAEPVAARINADKQNAINGVTSVQETVKNYLKALKEAAEAGKPVNETSRKLIAAAPKDPKAPTADEIKAKDDLTAQLKTEFDQFTSKMQSASQGEPQIKKLFPQAAPASAPAQ